MRRLLRHGAVDSDSGAIDETLHASGRMQKDRDSRGHPLRPWRVSRQIPWDREMTPSSS